MDLNASWYLRSVCIIFCERCQKCMWAMKDQFEYTRNTKCGSEHVARRGADGKSKGCRYGATLAGKPSVSPSDIVTLSEKCSETLLKLQEIRFSTLAKLIPEIFSLSWLVKSCHSLLSSLSLVDCLPRSGVYRLLMLLSLAPNGASVTESHCPSSVTLLWDLVKDFQIFNQLKFYKTLQFEMIPSFMCLMCTLSKKYWNFMPKPDNLGHFKFLPYFHHNIRIYVPHGCHITKSWKFHAIMWSFLTNYFFPYFWPKSCPEKSSSHLFWIIPTLNPL